MQKCFMMNSLKIFGSFVLISSMNLANAVKLTDNMESSLIGNVSECQTEIQEKIYEKFTKMCSLENTIYDVLRRNLSRLDELIAALDFNKDDINAEICSIFDFVNSPMSQLNGLISGIKVNSAIFSSKRSLFSPGVELQTLMPLQSELVSTFLIQDEVIQRDINRFKGYENRLKQVRDTNQLSLQSVTDIKQEFINFSMDVSEHISSLDRIISEEKARIDELKSREILTTKKNS